MIKILHELIPASTVRIQGIETLTADNVLTAFDEQGVRFTLVKLSNGDWEIESSEMTDKEILESLNIDQAGHLGSLQICTEACTRYGLGPFSCHSSELKAFIENYDHDMFFDGDVIIICKESRTITVFHHAGGYVHVRV